MRYSDISSQVQRVNPARPAHEKVVAVLKRLRPDPRAGLVLSIIGLGLIQSRFVVGGGSLGVLLTRLGCLMLVGSVLTTLVHLETLRNGWGRGTLVCLSLGMSLQFFLQSQSRQDDHRPGAMSVAHEGRVDSSAPSGEVRIAVAPDPVDYGDLRIRLLQATLVPGGPPVKEGEAPTGEPVLELVIDLMNTNPVRRMDDLVFYVHELEISDGLSNRYQPIADALGTEQDFHGSLYPGESLTRVCRFERPVDKAAYLELRIPDPRKQMSMGSARLRIPRSMIVRQASDEGESPLPAEPRVFFTGTKAAHGNLRTIRSVR